MTSITVPIQRPASITPLSWTTLLVTTATKPAIFSCGNCLSVLYVQDKNLFSTYLSTDLTQQALLAHAETVISQFLSDVLATPPSVEFVNLKAPDSPPASDAHKLSILTDMLTTINSDRL